MLEINDLNIDINGKIILTNINFKLSKGEKLGIVGKSGVGKSTLIKYIIDNYKDSINISYILQDAINALNPYITIKKHFKLFKQKDIDIYKLLEEVSLDKEVLNKYPNELSGGMRQRIVICLALLKEPDLIIADEPTSYLDNDTEREVIELLERIINKNKKTLIVISHNLDSIKYLCDRVIYLQDGKILYDLSSENLSCIEYEKNKKREHGEIILQLQNINKAYGKKEVLRNINLELYENEVIGIIGKSGVGKSTLAKIIYGLEDYEGKIIGNLDEVQMIFQNSFNSFNPMLKIKKSLEEVSKENIELYLNDCKLDISILDKFPSECSGGELQRLSIIRILLKKSKILIADEITSSLDEESIIDILELLNRLQLKYRFSVIFISHNLNIIESYCDRIIKL